MKFAVIQTGGKQYLVRENEEIIVDFVKAEPETSIDLPKLAEGDFETGDIEIGKPLLKTQTKVLVMDNIKGDKLRVLRFRAKTRGRRVTGFRANYSKIKIVNL